MAIARNSTPLIVPQVKSTDFSAVYSRNRKLLPAVSRLAQCQNISNVRYQARSKLVAVGSRFAIDSSARERAGSRARRPPISEKLKASSDTYLLPRCVVFPGVTVSFWSFGFSWALELRLWRCVDRAREPFNCSYRKLHCTTNSVPEV